MYSKGFSLLEVMLACSLMLTVLLGAQLMLARQGVRIEQVKQRWLHYQRQINQLEAHRDRSKRV